MKFFFGVRNCRCHLLLPFALVAGFALPMPVLAASIALATAPLATSTTTTVQPNVFLMMDDSGSMGWDYLPDGAGNFSGAYGYNSYQCNGVYYDPAITYVPPIDYTGTSFPNSSFTAAWNDGYNTGSGTTNLSTSFTTQASGSGAPAYYYNYSGTQTSNAQKDYLNTSSTFYQECNSSIGSTPGSTVFTKVVVSATSGPGGTDERTNFANWYSYYSTRINMMKTASGIAFQPIGSTYRVGFGTMNNNGGGKFLNVHTFNATQKSAWYTMLYSTSAGNSTPLLGALADVGKMYGGKLTSKNGVTVTDPVQYSCQQNFTILTTDGYWNSQTGDTELDGATPVGNQDGTLGRPMYDGAQSATTWTYTYNRDSYIQRSGNCPRRSWYLDKQPQTGTCTSTSSTSGCSPTNWTNSGTKVSGTSCVSTRAYVTASVLQGSPVQTAGTVGGTSNTLSDVAMYYYQTDLRTTALGNCSNGINSENVCTNNVFSSSSDNNTQQHMTTFTLGLGAKGRMVYSSSYLVDSSGDFPSVKLGLTASSTAIPPICSWQANGTTCNWPIPNPSGTPENIDDLWHAAVDGHGAYFNATNPTSLSASLASALSGINARKGSAAAAATSTLNPVAGNNFAYVASYTTVTWKGNLEARGINVDTGVVNTNATWCAENVTADTCSAPGTVVADTSGSTAAYNCVTPNAVICTGGTMIGTDCYVPVATACTGTMASTVSDTSDTRSIFTAPTVNLTPLTGQNLVPFDTSYATVNPVNFSATHINGLSQWSSLTTTQQAAAAGANLINFLRGQHGYENRSTNPTANWLYRFREAVLGDALESQPAFISSPVFSYPYPGYSNYVTAQASRAGTVYMGANDGMMHAFDANTGIERWAYVPSMVIPNMWILADLNYSTLHQNFVNGSAITSDVCTANCTDAVNAVWKTILVGGLNAGGRGYYALDITNPTSPVLLWEFTTTAGIGSTKDDDLGYSYGQPVITKKNDGTWVVLVTSGYNNVNPGSGQGFLYVLNAGTGAIISKISTGVGSTSTISGVCTVAPCPSGLAKIAGWNDEQPVGNKVGYVYGGDLFGNLWRFDINSSVAATIGTGDVLKFAVLYADTAGTIPQPITTTPVLGLANNMHYVFISTGKYLETGDLTTTQTQSLYSIRDLNASATLVNPRNTLPSQTLTQVAGTNTRTSTNNPVPAGGPGCYADYPATGERANLDSKLVQGILIAPTIVPSNTACSPGGYSWLNYFNYQTCGATGVESDSPIVGVNVMYIQGSPIVEIVTSTNPTPTAPSVQPPFQPPAPGFSGKRTMWRELIP
ncbi:hypothetical protein GALL_215380 [mine drainage metagenome]|uniref:PilY1 beta-propeller domain-containing protein n=1 Tax=mine drainage metagenome TaxID=410659 RepID=A0A1J5RLA0_9ZZZZ